MNPAKGRAGWGRRYCWSLNPAHCHTKPSPLPLGGPPHFIPPAAAPPPPPPPLGLFRDLSSHEATKTRSVPRIRCHTALTAPGPLPLPQHPLPQDPPLSGKPNSPGGPGPWQLSSDTRSDVRGALTVNCRSHNSTRSLTLSYNLRAQGTRG